MRNRESVETMGVGWKLVGGGGGRKKLVVRTKRRKALFLSRLVQMISHSCNSKEISQPGIYLSIPFRTSKINLVDHWVIHDRFSLK